MCILEALKSRTKIPIFYVAYSTIFSSSRLISFCVHSSYYSQMKPLLIEGGGDLEDEAQTSIPPSNGSNANFIQALFQDNPEFFRQALKFLFCFGGLQASYLTWGYMQELIMTTKFNPTEHVPTGKFPSAAFCVFSNRFLAVIVAMVAVKIRHGAVFSNNVAPLLAFTPCALSNTMSSWSQYASLKYVSFPLQTIFKSSKGML